jgi:hypothetical protein
VQNAQDFVVTNSSVAVTGKAEAPAVVRVGGPLTKDVDLRGLAAGAGGVKVEGRIGETVRVPGR